MPRLYHREFATPRKCVAFTLIELLVVIAIIAVLAAILFPVFAQVRAKARQSSCQSNFKQIALACHNYHDVNERLPPAGKGYGWCDNSAGTGDAQIFNLNGLVLILPFLEQDNLFARMDVNSAMSP